MSPGWGGFFIFIRLSTVLVIVQQIEVVDVAIGDSENHPPVAGHGDGRKTPQVALQRMKPPAWQVRFFSLDDPGQHKEYSSKTRHLILPDTFGVIALEEAFEPLVSKREDHRQL